MEENKIIGTKKGKEDMGIPVHSQVRKIKQESEKIEDWPAPEMRPVLREITKQQLSRSPLGLGGRPISVGDM
ncbi:hypothetical protein SLE2022_346820 [Rubroshorea leprosula]|uniref:Uncharacterized protein n=1 Tax=Rubroshorea leprosula TaxID=152421 RepID=A0AAV5J479_9ROSI|nr:hypothetical protein SLEP1_g17266 [Rubroshorea leprosula]